MKIAQSKLDNSHVLAANLPPLWVQYCCIHCGGSVKIYRGPTQRPHFRHRYGETDQACILAAKRAMKNIAAKRPQPTVDSMPVDHEGLASGPQAEVHSTNVSDHRASSGLLWWVVVVVMAMTTAVAVAVAILLT